VTAKRVQRLLHASAFVRAMATSTAGVTLGGFLGKLDAGGLELGIVVERDGGSFKDPRQLLVARDAVHALQGDP
jgi:hypothetical protein